MRTVRILVDGDACPVRAEIERCASELGVPVRVFANASQRMESPADRVVVGDGTDAADFALFRESASDSVVVTDDIGLAAMALSRGAAALSSRGRRFEHGAIETQLHLRHLGRKARRAGKRTGGPPPFTGADRRRFVRALTDCVTELMNSSDRQEPT